MGGGFDKGIHNTLEAATWGIPVLFGPRHSKFIEAAGLINAGAAHCIGSAQELSDIIGVWIEHPSERRTAGNKAAEYVERHAGATQAILGSLSGVLEDERGHSPG